MKYFRNFWNGLAIVLFMGFVISLVVNTSRTESTAIMQQADLAALTTN